MWAKGLKLEPQKQLMISWNVDRLCFNTLQRLDTMNQPMMGRLIYQFQHITTIENHITDVQLNLHYKYFVIGTSLGNIMVYKYHDGRKKMIHQYEGHFREVGSLTEHPKDNVNLFISSSLDGVVKIWCLDVSIKPKFPKTGLLNYCFRNFN